LADASADAVRPDETNAAAYSNYKISVPQMIKIKKYIAVPQI